MMDNPLISIIVPSYNHLKFIECCIESIINQTYKNIELIVIDDGSADGTKDLIVELAKKYKFAYILKENNLGLVNSLNTAILEHVNGEYVSIIASDDYFCEDKVFKQLEFLKNQTKFDIVYSRTYYVNSNSQVWGKSDYSTFRGGDIFKDLFLGYFHMPPMTIMYKTEVLKTIFPIPENVYNEDKYIALKLSEKHLIGFLDEYLTFYRKHSTNASNDSYKTYISSLEIIKQYKHHELYDKALDTQALYWFSSLSKNHKTESLKWILRASKRFYSKFFIAGVFNLMGFPIEAYYSKWKQKK
ncbi:MAG: glycosyltransferase [Chitinophagales bacterium]|nr:glycosyltransferase [Chitinophagales bacterium]